MRKTADTVEIVDPVEFAEPEEPDEVVDTSDPVEFTEPEEPDEVVDTADPVEFTEPDEVVDATDSVEFTEPDEVVDTADPVEFTEPDEVVEATDPVEFTEPDEVVDAVESAPYLSDEVKSAVRSRFDNIRALISGLYERVFGKIPSFRPSEREVAGDILSYIGSAFGYAGKANEFTDIFGVGNVKDFSSVYVPYCVELTAFTDRKYNSDFTSALLSEIKLLLLSADIEEKTADYILSAPVLFAKNQTR